MDSLTLFTWFSFILVVVATIATAIVLKSIWIGIAGIMLFVTGLVLLTSLNGQKQ